jgi:anhydro-N-acetylmuramic acid kinase
MSGTSVDGIDAALVEVAGSGSTLGAQLQHFVTVPFPIEIRQRILNLCESGSVAEVARLNVVLGELFAEAVLHLLSECRLKPEDVDLIGSH